MTKTKGIALVELLMVIAVVGILAAILLPAILTARDVQQPSGMRSISVQMGLASAVSWEGTHLFLQPTRQSTR